MHSDINYTEFKFYNISVICPNNTIIELQGYSDLKPDEDQGMIIGKEDNTNKKLTVTSFSGLTTVHTVAVGDNLYISNGIITSIT